MADMALDESIFKDILHAFIVHKFDKQDDIAAVNAQRRLCIRII